MRPKTMVSIAGKKKKVKKKNKTHQNVIWNIFLKIFLIFNTGYTLFKPMDDEGRLNTKTMNIFKHNGT